MSFIRNVIISKENEIKEFQTMKDAARFIGCGHQSISRCIANKRQIYGWFVKEKEELSLPDEEWRDHPYLNVRVSNLGRVKIGKGRISRGSFCRKYLHVRVGRGIHYVHRLVAQTFVDNPGNKKEVDHIDWNPSNNRAQNLQWATRSENAKRKKTII